MKQFFAVRAGLAVTTACLSALSMNIHAKEGWQRIEVPSEMTVTLADGTMRDVSPSCSGGPTLINPELPPGPGNLAPADTDFAFFVKPGNENRILFFMDGGGACWDAETCIGSPLIGDSSYAQSVTETVEGLEQAGGVLSSSNGDNPFKKYTQVFVPYCTGDIHFGTKDTTYTLPLGPGVTVPWTIRHRGVDNFLATIHMLNTSVRKNENTLVANFDKARRIMVTGVSAGGYGATAVFPYIAEDARPKAKLNLVSDSAVGVQTNEFYSGVIYDVDGNDSWGVVDALPPWVPAYSDPDFFLNQATGNAAQFQPLLWQALSSYKPEARLASVTPNLDSVQIGFYAITRPGVSIAEVAAEWYLNALSILNQTAALPNYRIFIEEGAFHTFLASDRRFYEAGVLGIPLRNWIRAMTRPGDGAWENLDAGPPALLNP
ncbi:MAG: pectin acetylesterase-family hydrolase [Pseudomonadota bacterium]